MTPEQHIKHAILLKYAEWIKTPISVEVTAENIDDLYHKLVDEGAHWDAKSEVRCGEVDTDLPADFSRHYESKSVAANINGKWVGWTYWYGGGKYGEPEAMDWMSNAYFLDYKEEEKVVTVRTFTKLEAVNAE